MIGSFAVAAMMIGASVGGKLISLGRQKVLILSSLIGICGTTSTLFINLPLILAGRSLYGFSCGLIAVAMPRMMEEVLPPYLVSFYGGLYSFSFSIATIIAYLLALGLPQDKLDDGNKNTL